MLRLTFLALALCATACTKANNETKAEGAAETAEKTEAAGKPAAKMGAVGGDKAPKIELTKEKARKALMTPPSEKNLPPMEPGAASRLYPENAKNDPAVKEGEVLGPAKRRCVDSCFDRLDVENVCERRVPPTAKDRPAELVKCRDGARRFCGVRCGTIAPPNMPKRPDLPLAEPKPVNKEEAAKRLGLKAGEKLFVTFKTNQGDMVAELFWEQVPNTVTNFVELAEGKRDFIDPKADAKLPAEKRTVKRRYYDGLIFHRVIPNFMIQGGCPLGSGMGGPGYNFRDEFVKELKHEGPGILSMANSGPATNGSQFFITEKSTPHLDGRHTVFGKLISGADIQKKIAGVPTAARNKPKADVVMQKVLIGRGQPAK